jgi:hypothetical protein
MSHKPGINPRTLLLFASMAAFGLSMSAQEPELIVPEYLAAKYTAAADAPSMVTVAGQDEAGQRLMVTGRTLDGGKPVEDDPVVVGRRKYGIPLMDPDAFKNGPCKSRPDCVLTRPVTRDARGVWRVTRDIQMVRNRR